MKLPDAKELSLSFYLDLIRRMVKRSMRFKIVIEENSLREGSSFPAENEFYVDSVEEIDKLKDLEELFDKYDNFSILTIENETYPEMFVFQLFPESDNIFIEASVESAKVFAEKDDVIPIEAVPEIVVTAEVL